jgi:hypothetical protein
LKVIDDLNKNNGAISMIDARQCKIKYIPFSWLTISALLLFMFFMGSGFAQSESEKNKDTGGNTKNVEYQVSDGRVYITYDLSGSPDQLFDVTLKLKRLSNLKVEIQPETVFGDVGEGNFAGENRRIVWDINKDFPQELSGEDYYFTVQAEKISEGPNVLMWVGIGLAAVAAVVTYIFVDGEQSLETQSPGGGGSFPPPPGRP